MKKPVKMLTEYQRLAKRTNALGLTDYDINALSNQQKGRLTRLENSEFRDAIKNKKEFTILDVSRTFARNAKQAGALVSNGRLFVRNKYFKGKPTYTKMRIEDGLLKFSEIQRGSSSGDRIELKHTVHYPGTKGFFDVSKKIQDGTYKMGANNRVTFKIGGNSPFQTSYSDLNSLYAYVSEMMAGKVFRNQKNGKNIYNVDFGKILPEISFVEVKRTKVRKPKNGS